MYFSHVRAWFTCSSVHASTLHPLLAHHCLCYVNDCCVYDLTFLFRTVCVFFNWVGHRIIFVHFCHGPPSVAIFDFRVYCLLFQIFFCIQMMFWIMFPIFCIFLCFNWLVLLFSMVGPIYIVCQFPLVAFALCKFSCFCWHSFWLVQLENCSN